MEEYNTGKFESNKDQGKMNDVNKTVITARQNFMEVIPEIKNEGGSFLQRSGLSASVYSNQNEIQNQTDKKDEQ